MKNRPTLTGIQDAYIKRVNAGFARWSHRKDGGHFARIARGARRAAEKSLRRLGFSEQSDPSIDYVINQARDVAELERNED